MPKAKATGRKRSEISVASSGESIEDEELMLENCENAGSFMGSSLKKTSECHSDKETDANVITRDSASPEAEMTKIMELFGNDMTKTLIAKRRKMEKFSDAAIKINVNKMSKVWNEQLKSRNSVNEQFNSQINDTLRQWEVDLSRQSEQAEKVHGILLQYLKAQRQIHQCNAKKLSSLHSICESHSENMKSLEVKCNEQHELVNQEMKTELMLLQKKLIMEYQQQDLQEVRKSVQTLLFS